MLDAHTSADRATHDLSHSSEPTGAEPAFQPIATERAGTSDEALIRLADEVVDLARRERDAYSAIADLGASDPREGDLTLEVKTLEKAIMDRFMMQSLIRAETQAGLAAKGRAALAYRETLENCQVAEIQPLLLSMADDAVRLSMAPITTAANQLVDEDDRPASPEQFAAIDFEPWSSDEAMPLNAEQWSEHLGPTGEHAMNVRLACSILCKTKPQLLDAMRRMEANNPNGLVKAYDAFSETAKLFDALKTYAEGAALRLLNIGATLVQEENAAAQRSAAEKQAA